MSLEEDIATWANGRAPWQRRMLHQLCAGQTIGEAEITRAVDELVAGVEPTVEPLQPSQVPGGQAAGDPVVLSSLTEPTNINALVEDQTLTFGRPNGLTVVYGDNASGKSGYARVIKASVKARHEEAVLANVFDGDASSKEQRAMLGYELGTEKRSVTWPVDDPVHLTRMHFYDEACGDTYIGGESELTYRPSALTLLDRLIDACDRVRAELDRRLADNQAQRASLPSAPVGTIAANFVANLSAATTSEDIDAVTKLPDDAAGRRVVLAHEEARLAATDPAKEKARLERVAGRLEEIAAHVELVTEQVGADAASALNQKEEEAEGLRTAAAVASSASFDAEPLAGVGSTTWRALWEAARAFSEHEAYHQQAFPVVGAGARCVLCQQELAEEGADRMSRFQAYMSDQTEKHATEAEQRLASVVRSLRELTVLSAEVAAGLASLETGEPALASEARAWLDAASERKAYLLRPPGQRGHQVPGLPDSPVTALRDRATQLRTAASALSDPTFNAQLDAVRREQWDLEGRLSVAAGRAAIETEVARLKVRVALEGAKQASDTGPITRKSSELTREHVTKFVRDQFTRESDRLSLQKITLADTGGYKGQLRHRPALLGAETSVSVMDVLSEGEQTALGLAGYFTEAHFDASGSGLVLDDPVTSLDHIRRASVARRLAEFAVSRQVIVFTHDVAFVGDLRRAAEASGADFVERSIQRRGGGNGLPGVCVDGHPWKARDVKARFDELTRLLAEIKRDRTNWSQDEYEDKCAAWAGKLSETWERTINAEVVNPVVDRGAQQVHPKMFKLLARITEQDDQEFQQSYERASAWVRRHDKSEETNYVAPEPTELESELDLVRAWFDRVRKYRN